MKKSLAVIFLLLFLNSFCQIKNFNGIANFSTNGIHWSGTTAPVVANDVVIQSGTATIIGSDVITINNLTIDPSATLQFTGPGKLVINGTFQNNGTLLFNAGGADVQVVNNVTGTGQFNCSNQPFKMSLLGALNTFSGSVIGNTNSTFIYGGGVQSMIRADYFKLILTGTGIKSLASGTSVNILDSLILDNNATFDYQTSVLLGGHLKNNGVLQSSTSPFVFNSFSDQSISGNGVFNFNSLVVMKSASSALIHNSPSVISVSNQLNLNLGVFKLQSGDLKSSGSINGSFGPTSMIETNVGKFIKVINSTADMIFNFPLGYVGLFHEISISSATISGTGSLEMKINPLICSNCGDRSVSFLTAGTLAVTDIQFSMRLGSNVTGSPNKVFKNLLVATGAPINIVTLPYTFGYTGNLAPMAGLSGEWKLASASPVFVKIEKRVSPGTAISSGCAADKIVVVGQNLSGITTLQYNAINLTGYTVSVGGDSLFINGIPTSGTSGTISVTTPFGSTSIPYNVLASPDPNSTFAVPSSVCSAVGMTVEIPTAQAGINYQVLFNNTIASSAQGTPAAAGYYTLTVPGIEMTAAGLYNTRLKMSVGGCIDTTIQTTTVTVFAGPTITSANTATKCASDISLSPGIGNATGVNWTGGSGTYLPNTTSPSITYAPTVAEVTGGSISLTVTASKVGCPDAVKNITVSILPVPTASLVTGTDTICQGASFNLSLVLAGTAPFTGLSLTPTAGGIINIGSIPSASFSQAVTPVNSDVTYTLTEQAAFFMDAMGCRGVVTGTHRVVSEVMPTASIGGGPLTMCQGGNINIPVTISGKHPVNVVLNGSGVNYSGTANTGTSLSISVSPSTNSTIIINSVSSAHCPSGTSAGSVVVEVKPLVNPAVALSHLVDTICETQTINLGINTQLNVGYVCSLSNTALNPSLNGNGSLMTIPLAFANPLIPSGNNTILVIATGCNVDTLDQTFVLKKSGLISNFDLDTVNGTKLCGSSAVQLSTSNSFTQIIWKVNGSIIVGAATSNYSPLIAGNYNATLIDALTCQASSKDVQVGYQNLKPLVTQTSVSTYQTNIHCTTASAQYYWYAWVDGGVKRIVGESASTYAANFDGTYYVSYPANGCYIFSDPISVTGKAGGSLLKQSFSVNDTLIYIPKLNWQDPISVYPNPILNGDKLTVSFLNSRGAEVIVELFSADGTRIKSLEASGQGLIEVEMLTDELKPGLYFLRMDDGLKTVGSNLVVH